MFVVGFLLEEFEMKYIFELVDKKMILKLVNEDIPEETAEIVLREEYKEIILMFTRDMILEELQNRLFVRMANLEIDELTK